MRVKEPSCTEPTEESRTGLPAELRASGAKVGGVADAAPRGLRVTRLSSVWSSICDQRIINLSPICHQVDISFVVT
jgi:hypothetical protein